MIVNLYGFQKKKNSTAQPSISSATVLNDVELKDDTSVLTPVLLINQNTSGMPVPFVPSYFTYAYIPKFDRYYYINDARWVSGLWELYLSVDVLASFKNTIGNLTEYVLRCSNTFDTSISDITYPVTTNYAVTKSPIDLRLDSTGFYVLGIISNSSAVSEGAISYYIMTAAEMANFKSYLMSETFLTANGLADLEEINKNLVKCIYNPYQYIVSCKYFPMAYPSNEGTAVTSINFGWWTIPQAARLVSGLVIFSKQSQEFTQAAHPQASRGRYLNHAPYTELYVMHPMIGTILLDSNKIEATNKVIITITADGISGQGVIDITNTTRGIRLYESIINFAQDIPLAQINTDVLGLARTAVNSAGDLIAGAAAGMAGGVVGGAVGAMIGGPTGGATGAFIGGAVGALAGGGSGILNTIQASIPILQSSGVNGNKANYYFPADFYTVHRQIVNEDNAHRGRPLCQVKTLNTIPGFILCADGHFSASCYESERQAVNDYLRAGFYYE